MALPRLQALGSPTTILNGRIIKKVVILGCRLGSDEESLPLFLHCDKGKLNYLCYAAIVLLDVLIYCVLIHVDTLVAVALWEFLPKSIADGDDNCRFGLAFFERVVHRCQLLLNLVKQLHSNLLDFLDLVLGQVVPRSLPSHSASPLH